MGNDFSEKTMDEVLNDVCVAMSEKRLARYDNFLNCHSSHLGAIFIPYILIQTATAQLYPTIQLIEICLRNKINVFMCIFCQSNPDIIPGGHSSEQWYEWFPSAVKKGGHKSTLDNFMDAKKRAKKGIRDRDINSDDVIANVFFGIWIQIIREIKNHSLFKNRYGTHFIKTEIFSADRSPSLPKILSDLEKIKKMRNRIFHHEPIWSAGNVKTFEDAQNQIKRIHQDLLDVLAYISPSVHLLYSANGMMGYSKSFDVIIDRSFKQCIAMNKLFSQFNGYDSTTRDASKAQS